MTHTYDRQVAARARRQHALITTRQGLDLGLTPKQIQARDGSGQWVGVTRGVHRIGAAPSADRQLLLAHILRGGPGTVASHRAAASLWRIPGFSPHVVEVSKPRGRSQRIAHGRIHGSLWLPERHVTEVEGIPVTTPARTIFDLAGWYHPKRVKRAFENALNMGLVQPLQQAALVAELGKRGRRGTALMRKLCKSHGVDYVAPASELEALLLDVLAETGLPAPDQQVDVGDEEGWIGRVDFLYRKAKLVIEADGVRWHHPDDDRERDDSLTAAGWQVIRVTWEQLVNRPGDVAAAIRNLLQ
jgi:hypothetical protein